tara:strand:- start:142 stop:471 length:330 start_codon:yes stop_codon:yes gene_type:complete
MVDPVEPVFVGDTSRNKESGRVIVPPTEEEIAKKFSKMDAVVSRINWCVADDSELLKECNSDPEEVKVEMQRCVDHLESQMSSDWYKDSNKDKSSYVSAVAAGKNYIAS